MCEIVGVGDDLFDFCPYSGFEVPGSAVSGVLVAAVVAPFGFVARAFVGAPCGSGVA